MSDTEESFANDVALTAQIAELNAQLEETTALHHQAEDAIAARDAELASANEEIAFLEGRIRNLRMRSRLRENGQAGE